MFPNISAGLYHIYFFYFQRICYIYQDLRVKIRNSPDASSHSGDSPSSGTTRVPTWYPRSFNLLRDFKLSRWPYFLFYFYLNEDLLLYCYYCLLFIVIKWSLYFSKWHLFIFPYHIIILFKRRRFSLNINLKSKLLNALYICLFYVVVNQTAEYIYFVLLTLLTVSYIIKILKWCSYVGNFEKPVISYICF